MNTSRYPSPPGLSRASTPDSYSPPATPTLPSAFPRMSNQKPQVGFASPATTSAFRRPAWDELSVMRAFAAHANHCDRCYDPAQVLRRGQTLCRTGTEYAKDIGKYFYCSEGRPYSTIDRNQKSERVQVEVPPEYAIVKVLFECLSRGLRFASLRPKSVQVHQQSYAAPAPAPAKMAPRVAAYEVKPYQSNSRRSRGNTYMAQTTNESRTPRYEVRTPGDYASRDAKRGSLYVSPDRRPQQKYVVRYP